MSIISTLSRAGPVLAKPGLCAVEGGIVFGSFPLAGNCEIDVNNMQVVVRPGSYMPT